MRVRANDKAVQEDLEGLYPEPPYVGEIPRPEPAKEPRRVFVVARPPARVVTLERDVFGRVVRQVAGESPTAASHWDADIWHPL